MFCRIVRQLDGVVIGTEESFEVTGLYIILCLATRPAVIEHSKQAAFVGTSMRVTYTICIFFVDSVGEILESSKNL